MGLLLIRGLKFSQNDNLVFHGITVLSDDLKTRPGCGKLNRKFNPRSNCCSCLISENEWELQLDTKGISEDTEGRKMKPG